MKMTRLVKLILWKLMNSCQMSNQRALLTIAKTLMITPKRNHLNKLAKVIQITKKLHLSEKIHQP
jgi:hypothetical protein